VRVSEPQATRRIHLAGVRCVCSATDLDSMKQRLKALEARVAGRHPVKRRSSRSKTKADKEAHGSSTGAQAAGADTFCRHVEGRWRVYQQTFIDTT
jgi:hypothetical protein